MPDFDIDAFRHKMSKLNKQDGSPYSQDGKKNFLQALNKVQRNVTDNEMFDMALILFENDVNVLDFLNGNVPMNEKRSHFSRQNSNRSMWKIQAIAKMHLVQTCQKHC